MVDPIITFLNKVAYKFPKGYPDMNDPKDYAELMKMKNLQSLYPKELLR